MQAISTQKFVKVSPRKLRLVADMVRGKSVNEVLEFLPFVNKTAALPVQKVVKTAASNAVVKGADIKDLKVASIEIGEGPRLKRFRPVSRGQAHGFVRQMSHIKVVVGSVASPKAQKGKAKKDEKAVVKDKSVKKESKK